MVVKLSFKTCHCLTYSNMTCQAEAPRLTGTVSVLQHSLGLDCVGVVGLHSNKLHVSSHSFKLDFFF